MHAMGRALSIVIISKRFLPRSFGIFSACDENTYRLSSLHFIHRQAQSRGLLEQTSRRTSCSTDFQESPVEEYLCDALSCCDATARKILTKYPEIRECSRFDLSQVIQVLKRAAVPTEHVLRYPWLLALRPDDLKSKLDLLSSVRAVNIATLPLLRHHEKSKLQAFVHKKRFYPPSLHERIDCLCRCLEAEPEELSDRLIRHSDLLNMDVQKIQNIVDLLKEAKVPRHLISSDLWLFYLKKDKIAQRLSQIRPLDVEIRPWVLRATEKEFQAWLKKRKGKIEVFGHEMDHVDYLAERLRCSHEFVRTTMMAKNSRILNINPPKLKEVLDFLFEKGYTAEDIRDTPTILSRSLNTIRKRILEIEKLGFTLPHLKLLRQDSKDYEANMKKIRNASERLGKKPLDGGTSEETSSIVKI